MPDSANDLTTFNQQFWAPEMQAIYFKENVARAIANEELRDVLVEGTRVHRPYRSPLKDQAYVKGVDISTFNDLTGQNEYLDIDTTRIVPFYVDDIDKLENKWDMAAIYAKDAQQVLNNRMDQAVFSEGSNAFSFISAQDLGGSGTGAASVNIANISNLFTVAGRVLDKWNRGQNKRFSIIGPRLRESLRLAVSGRETAFGDKIGLNGLIGERYGFNIRYSNNVPFTAVITSNAIGVAAEYFYIDGVKFQFKADGGNCIAAGDIDIGGSEATTMASLVLAINGTATPTVDTYYDVVEDDREALHLGGIVASFDTHTLTITGFGDVVIDVDGATNLSLTSNVQRPLFGVEGAIDFVVEKEPNVEFRMAEKRLGKYVYPWTRYGKKTFTKEKKSLVYAKVDTSAWV